MNTSDMMTEPCPDVEMISVAWDDLSQEMIGLSAIKEGVRLSRTFPKSEREDALRWIRNRQNERYSIYIHQGDVRHDLGGQSAKKEDVQNAYHVWCDIDIAAENTREAQRAAILEDIEHFELETDLCCVVEDSGNGFFVKLRYDEPNEDVELQERLNGALIKRLHGDSGTQDFGRLLGLPGTVNYPGQRKTEMGRVPRLRAVYRDSQKRYSVEYLASVLLSDDSKEVDPIAWTFDCVC